MNVTTVPLIIGLFAIQRYFFKNIIKLIDQYCKKGPKVVNPAKVVEVDPIKVLDPVVVNPAKVVEVDPIKLEQVNVDPIKVEQVNIDPIKVDPIKIEQVNVAIKPMKIETFEGWRQLTILASKKILEKMAFNQKKMEFFTELLKEVIKSYLQAEANKDKESMKDLKERYSRVLKYYQEVVETTKHFAKPFENLIADGLKLEELYLNLDTSTQKEYSDKINEMKFAIQDLKESRMQLKVVTTGFLRQNDAFKRMDNIKRGFQELINCDYGVLRCETDQEDYKNAYFYSGTVINSPFYHGINAPCYEKVYKIESLLGMGAMSHCFQVLDLKSNLRYAMKVLKTEILIRDKFLMNESLILKNLKHPNIVEFIDSFNSSEHFFMLFGLCNNGTLKSWHSNFIEGLKGGLNEEKRKEFEAKVLKYIRQTIEGLMYLRDNRIIHNDLKPTNIFIDDNGNIRIGDFGMSQIASEDGIALSNGNGTPVYMAPEAFKGYSKTHSFQADVWALGAIIFELLTGKKTLSILETGLVENGQPLKQHLHIKKENLAPEWESLILKMLDLDPMKRPSLEEIIKLIPTSINVL
ncbi:Cell cycle serine/threonine-protein kinase cdc5/MSD2 [Glugoides intestinalis]